MKHPFLPPCRDNCFHPSGEKKNGIFPYIIWMQFDNEDLRDLEMPDLSQPRQLCSLPHAVLTSPSLASLRPHLMLFPSSSSLLISWGLKKTQTSIFKDISTVLYGILMWGRWTDWSKLVWPHNHAIPWAGRDPLTDCSLSRGVTGWAPRASSIPNCPINIHLHDKTAIQTRLWHLS